MTISRRAALQALGFAAVGAPLSLSAQGRCMLTFGSPACNTNELPPTFAPTGWKTVALDHIGFRAADYRKEAAFYVALMGWTLRSDDGQQAMLDMGDWGSAIFKSAPASSFDAPAGGGRQRRGRANRFASRSTRSRSSSIAGTRRPSRRSCASADSIRSPSTTAKVSRASASRIPTAGTCRSATATASSKNARRRRPTPSSPSRCRSSRPAGKPCGSITSRSTPATTRRARRSTRTCSAGRRPMTRAARTSC